MDLDEDRMEEQDEDEDEEDEWAGLGEGGVDTSTGPSGGGGKPKKPPTGEEVRAIKEATDLYKSNTFKLRVRTFPYFSISAAGCRFGPGEVSWYCRRRSPA